jgi:hypothetical protein
VKPDRLIDLRDAIAAGRYEVPAELVAEALLPWLLVLPPVGPDGDKGGAREGGATRRKRHSWLEN